MSLKYIRLGLMSVFTVSAVCGSAVASPPNWPQFRGPQASGVADGANPPTTWNAETGANIKWKTPIPGLGHSSPVVWGDRVFVTTAVGEEGEPYLRPGLYGESPDNPEDFIHHYRVYCLDKDTGRVLWEQTAHHGKPQVNRHIKSSHANCTPATDGKHVVAFFGSEGLYCYDLDGKLLWKKDLGRLDAGAFDAPEIQWGFGSSPIIYEGKIIVLCDVNNQSFITAFDVATGAELWRTPRNEVPTWGTPTVHAAAGRTQVIVNGWKHIGGYDVETGQELWRMHGGGDIPVPTPFVAHDLVFITNAHGGLAPIYAIRADAEGDITLDEGATSNEHVAWARLKRGAYQPTPIVYGDYLYICNDRGILTCYEAKTGKQMYRERLAGQRGAYTASAVAADGKVYFTSEDGDTHVVKAGPKYELLGTNSNGGICLATPAICNGMVFVRTSKHLCGIAGGAQTRVESVTPKERAPVGAANSGDGQTAAGQAADVKRPAGELTDPVEILKRADAAAKAVKAVQYEISAEGLGALQAQGGSLKASVVVTGWVQNMPEKLAVDAEVMFPRATEPRRLTGGSDGDVYFVIDHESKRAHVDLELRVMGPYAQAIVGAVMYEFLLPQPFGDEINAARQELRGSKTIGDEECYEVHVVYASGGAEATWCFSKRDFLPREREDHYTLPDGQKGGYRRTITHLNVAPKIAPEQFKLKLPEGYTRTDETAQ